MDAPGRKILHQVIPKTGRLKIVLRWTLVWIKNATYPLPTESLDVGIVWFPLPGYGPTRTTLGEKLGGFFYITDQLDDSTQRWNQN